MDITYSNLSRIKEGTWRRRGGRRKLSGMRQLAWKKRRLIVGVVISFSFWFGGVIFHSLFSTTCTIVGYDYHCTNNNFAGSTPLGVPKLGAGSISSGKLVTVSSRKKEANFSVSMRMHYRVERHRRGMSAFRQQISVVGHSFRKSCFHCQRKIHSEINLLWTSGVQICM